MIPKKIMILLYFINEAKKIKGESKIQKMIFLLNKEKNIITGHSFISHNYGLYSSELKNDLDALKQFEFININKEKWENDFGFVGQISVYRINRNGQEVIKEQNIINEFEEKAIKEIIKEWNNKSVDEIWDYVSQLPMNEFNGL